MSDHDPHAGSAAARADHDLPMIRVHRAWEAAEKIADAHHIDRGIALSIAREAIAIVGEGTKRWGHLCPSCRSLVTWEDDRPRCPEHGTLAGLGFGPALTLLISFDPVMS